MALTLDIGCLQLNLVEMAKWPKHCNQIRAVILIRLIKTGLPALKGWLITGLLIEHSTWQIWMCKTSSSKIELYQHYEKCDHKGLIIMDVHATMIKQYGFPFSLYFTFGLYRNSFSPRQKLSTFVLYKVWQTLLDSLNVFSRVSFVKYSIITKKPLVHITLAASITWKCHLFKISPPFTVLTETLPTLLCL